MIEELEKDKSYILSVLQRNYKNNRNVQSENIKLCLHAVRNFCKGIEIENITRNETLFIFSGEYTVEILIGRILERIYIFNIGTLHLKEDVWCFSFDNSNNSHSEFINFINNQLD